MNPADVNPLAHPSYQQPIQKNKEQNNKAVEQIKTDTVTISQEAIAKSFNLKESAEASDEKVTNEIKGSSLSSLLKFLTKSDTSGKLDTASAIDQVTISGVALLKSLILKALSESSSGNNPASSYDKLRP
jgi:hypothetical protein